MAYPRFSISESTTNPATFEEDLTAYKGAGADGIGIWEFKLPKGQDTRLRDELQKSGLQATVCVPQVPCVVPDAFFTEPRDPALRLKVGEYDLVMAIEMLHDMPDPVGILQTMKRLAGDHGAVLVVDERAEETFTVPATEMERFFYTFSTLHCLAVSMQHDGVGTGTVIRPATLRRYAADAGFSAVDVLDVEHAQFLLYRLR